MRKATIEKESKLLNDFENDEFCAGLAACERGSNRERSNYEDAGEA